MLNSVHSITLGALMNAVACLVRLWWSLTFAIV